MMHSRFITEEWKGLESTAQSPLWRTVDALIVLRSGFATVVPSALRRLMALIPGLLMAGSLVTGLAALLWRSIHSYDSFLAVQGDFSLTQYTALVSDPQFRTVL